MAELLTLLDAEDERRREAALALPHSFDNCTYSLGHIRQAVYLCLTCALPHGICSACSIACHGDHEQVELFPKRDFQCDCPTSSLPHRCSLVKGVELPPNISNKYGQNFQNVFCRCGRLYDAKTERETMIQCLACEDWFHESCLNLRERVPPATGTTPPREPPPEEAATDGDEVDSVASDPALPRALLARDDYDAFLCGACVRDMEPIHRYAGTPKFLLVARPVAAEDSALWTIVGKPADAAPEASTSNINGKREREDDEAPAAKKARLDSSSCTAPHAPSDVQALLAGSTSSLSSMCDLFLVDEWRSHLCRCPSCLPALSAYPYLLEEEETYEPPEDPDVGLSIEELGLRALASGTLPHAQAVEGARLLGVLRDDLAAFLRPFAQEGRLVGEDDIRAFFEQKREELRSHLEERGA
ncbi:hypothetical protein EXIGLDRAFT_625540 [Exidia glandulosa HHB12029]|uniref:UBR-type domain-containing protein n=1 Tax=Exidia glandulosa HHB12029 TaxID=1314781 RepID=A0A165CZV3_EXIGL|nr:hypothetical protein EXIGLDRAFT_625540 [Exidia glandulosa HHB12029]